VRRRKESGAMIRALKAFLDDRGGNVAMMFGLALMPMLGAAGAAIDYSRMSSARAALSAAADAGALAGAANTGSESDREAAARQVFTSNLQRSGFPYTVRVRYDNIRDSGQNTGFRIEAETDMNMLFGWVLGSNGGPIATAAQARSGIEEKTELVFVLDTTASMEGDRIANLKVATNQMLDDLTARTTRPNLLKVGVVPFAQYVNVGLGNRNASWIDVPADYQTPVTTTCGPVWDVIGTTNCRTVTYPATPYTPPGTCMIDGRPRPCGGSPGYPAYTAEVCDNVYSATPRNVCWQSGGDWVRWDGCVGARAYPLNTQDGDYGTRIPGIMGVSCATPVQDLSNDIASVRSTINALTTMGETYLPAGLIWGKRMLSPGQPFPASNDSSIRKILVLVTDGRNTKSPTYPAHDGSDSALADQLTRETCQNIATDGSNRIKVYTVAFEMDGLDTKTILQDCAQRSGGQFYDATDAARLRAAFSDIVNAVYGVKLTQ
jgi:Flp pilus assembly protein TadG